MTQQYSTKRKTPADYEALARERGFVWLGPEAPNIRTKTGWQCGQAHRWMASYGDLSQGSGCPHCAADRRRKTPADYEALARERGFVWLGPEVANTRTKTGWQCGQAHHWMATYSSLSEGSGCPHCTGHIRKTPADYEALAGERGFVWLGPEVANVDTPTTWQCERGHRWQTTYGCIREGTGCPRCAREAQFGRQPIRKIPADYHELAAKRGFSWLGPEVNNTATKTWWKCEAGHRWQARYANIYSGQGCPHCAGVVPKTLADYEALARERGFVWLGPEVPNANAATTWECDQGHRWETSYSSIRRGQGCPHCAQVAPYLPADYHALAGQRGFTWLGPEVPNTHSLTGWQCRQGHQWQARYTTLHSGKGCPYCAGLVRKTPADYEVLARERGFIWLGSEAANAMTKTGWQCQHGHQWQAPYSNIQQGTGCPHCAGNVPKTPTDYHALAEARGFAWWGPEVASIATKTGWQCQQGHQWQACYGDIHAGKGCPHCARLARKIPAGDYHTLASARGFVWLGPEVASIATKTGWQCQQGHQWQTTYKGIHQGRGCPHCASNTPRTPADYHALATARGFAWLGPEVPNTDTATGWQCGQGHQWQARYRHIKGGRGCPFCARLGRGEHTSA